MRLRTPKERTLISQVSYDVSAQGPRISDNTSFLPPNHLIVKENEPGRAPQTTSICLANIQHYHLNFFLG